MKKGSDAIMTKTNAGNIQSKGFGFLFEPQKWDAARP